MAAPTWHLAKTFSVGRSTAIFAVVPISRKDVWAFGSGGTRGGPQPATSLAYHWDGRSWSPSGLPKGLTGNVYGGTAVSSSDVWAFSGGDEAGDPSPDRVLHWNGRSWSIVRQAFPGYLTGITAFGPRDVWVFGQTGAGPGAGTWHYDGRSWRRVKVPYPQGRASATSPHDIWAVGEPGDVLSHYNGHTWESANLGGVLPASPGNGYLWINGVYAASSRDVWATACLNTGNAETPFLVHWDGKAWHKTATSSPHCLATPTPDGRGGLWFTNSDRSALIHRSRAGAWSTSTVPGTRGAHTFLFDLARVPGTTSLWAAGMLQRQIPASTLGAVYSYSG